MWQGRSVAQQQLRFSCVQLLRWNLFVEFHHDLPAAAKDEASVHTLMAWFSEAGPLASSAGGCPSRASCAILPATAFVWLVPLTCGAATELS